MNSQQINHLNPTLYPLSMVDKLIDIEDQKRAIGIKNISLNDPVIQAQKSLTMPESLIIESLVQTAKILMLRTPDYQNTLALFIGVEKIEFGYQPVPGDQLRLEVEVLSIKNNVVTVDGHALVDGKSACKGVFSFTLVEEQTKQQIHPTASIHPTAIIGKDVKVGPYTIVGEEVVIGDNTILESNIKIEKWTEIGQSCHIHSGAIIGSEAQDMKYDGEKTMVIIGDRNIIREYVTIGRSTGPNTETRIGSDNLLMTNVHVGHNSVVGNHVIMANMASLAGHTVVEDYVNIGGMTGVHQFTRIGKGCMVGAYTRLLQDMPPFLLCEGNPTFVRGLNTVGLKRRGATKEVLSEIKQLFKTFYLSNKNTTQALEEINQNPPATEEGKYMLKFLMSDSKRGICKKTSDS